MPLYYTVDYNNLTKGEDYFIRVHPQGHIDEKDLATAISEDSSLSIIDVQGMLLSLPQQLARLMTEGKSAMLVDFLGFSLSCRLKKDVKISDPNYTLRSEDIDLHINVNSKSGFGRIMLNTLLQQKHPFVKLNTTTAKPQITRVFDFKTQTEGHYSVGSTFGIYGAHFTFPKDLKKLSQECGVFFALADGSEKRVTIYSMYKHDQIHCMPPTGVTGTVKIIVRQRNDNELVEAVFDNVKKSS